MKKLLLMLTVCFFVSCSTDDQNEIKDSISQNSLSVLDGKMLSFKDDDSFVKEYSDLAGLSTDELKNWVSSKKLVSLLTTTDNSADMEGDELSDTRVIYSDALKSVLNSDSKVKIADKVLWLNERTFYLLSGDEVDKSSEELLNVRDKLEIHGQLLSVSGSDKSLTSRGVIPNENRIKTFASEEINVSGSRLRHVLDLYNETIVLNDIIQSSKMYLRSTLQYKSCSTFRCTWKEAMNVRTLSSGLYWVVGQSTSFWNLYNISAYQISGAKTYLVGSWYMNNYVAYPYVNFDGCGPVTCTIDNIFPVPEISINISWY